MSGLTFAPLVPGWVLVLLGLTAIALTGLAVWRRARGAVWRAAAFAVLLAMLAGPLRTVRHTAPLDNIVVALVDQTASMAIDHRRRLVGAALAHLRAELPSGTRLKIVTLPPGAGTGTDLFAALRRAVATVPEAQRAGVVVLSDGEATDRARLAAAGRQFPVSLLIPARGAQTDRELRLLATPRYGLVGHQVMVRFVVRDHGVADHGAAVAVRVSVDGQVVQRVAAQVGVAGAVPIMVQHAGRVVVDLAAAALPGAVTTLNDQAVFALHGIRRRLTVLLIAGSPNQGLRSWRLLLKSDPSVRLVNFTILRDPDEPLAAPEQDVALIPFPVRRLFGLDLHRFDLVILDQFGADGVLPDFALANIAAHVRKGGALLVETGPSYDGRASLALTNLRAVLPVAPIAGGTVVGAFVPHLSAVGRRHPVTAALAQATMGPWYRFEQGRRRFGRTVLRAPGDAPLLVLGHAGRGRVAMLMSDQFWIWARGSLGQDPTLAGPALPLLRRTVHWLLGTPDLAGNFLAARIAQGQFEVTQRRIAGGPAGPVAITAPDGQRRIVVMTKIAPGRYRAALPASMPGVWRAQAGGLTAYAGAATSDAPEYRDLAASKRILAPLVDRTGGRVVWLGRDPTPSWRGLLRDRHAVMVTGLRRARLLPPGPVAILALLLVVLAWWRER
ncbi:MAG TPA: hypothetical protein PK677_03580 [Acidiphilium sp.]|nr:MAG: hypothetical protein B7Z67_00820 [Acidiphilium sp. 21-60-14]OYV90582.1 MAG: hypothetical protein B7Z57_08140 [Acidiphilium sp. 37-60-79]OZB41506.1 MAG: hypothetical protein B7X48_00350 [Acidiphilium sp. 34-60-192]HQT87616.1 hypothetical protein [Acidiphilium sp.]HQU24153.1 hypothetical protein [Acidiphilium sp.]